MKKNLKGLLAGLALAFALVLSSCVSKSYVSKVNKADEAGENLTYSEVVDDLGAPTIKFGTTGQFASGTLVWVKGCDTFEEVNEKYEAGKKLDALYITFIAGQAVSATWEEYHPE